jgi:hypothetical protein
LDEKNLKADEASVEISGKTDSKKVKNKKKSLKLAEQEQKDLKKSQSSWPQSDSKYRYLIKNREVRKHMKHRKAVMIMIVFLAVTILLGGGVYGMLSLLQYNNLKVLVDKEGMFIMSLSHDMKFSNPSEVISLGGPRYMDNITLMDIYSLIPEIEAAEGPYARSKEINCIAATFYLKNITKEDHLYRETMVFEEITKDIDEAIRIMIIRNGEKTVYAKKKKDGDIEEVVPGEYFTEDGKNIPDAQPWMTVPFISRERAYYETGLSLAAGEIVKYTVMIWLEGNDPECVDDILGGTLKMRMEFTQYA